MLILTRLVVSFMLLRVRVNRGIGGSDSNGEKNNELSPRPQFHRVFPSRNPSPRARFEKSHSRIVIENQEPAKSCGLTRTSWGFSITIVCEHVSEQLSS